MPELLEIVVKSPVIKSYKNVRQLKEIDLFDESTRQNEFKIKWINAVDQAI